MSTKDLELKTQNWSPASDSTPVAPHRECSQCDCASRVWNGRPDEWVCANHPDHAGQLTLVASGDGDLDDVGSRCRSFRTRRGPEVVQPPATPDEQVRYIGLTGGLFAIVDAADYEWLSKHTWRVTARGSGYACCTFNRKTVFMHRLIMNPPPGMVVDHINGNRWDNRRGNLRVCTQAENIRNRPSYRGTSRFKGVFWNATSGKWIAAIGCNGKSIRLGYFDDEVEAARAYDRVARRLFGQYAHLNFPDLTNIVWLAGRICVQSHARARLTVNRVSHPAKSEIRIPAFAGMTSPPRRRGPKFETIRNHQNPKFKTGPGLASAFRSLKHLNFGHCFGFPERHRATDIRLRRSCRYSCLVLCPVGASRGPPQGQGIVLSNHPIERRRRSTGATSQ